jgi:PAS domain S-box-containing protein
VGGFFSAAASLKGIVHAMSDTRHFFRIKGLKWAARYNCRNSGHNHMHNSHRRLSVILGFGLMLIILIGNGLLIRRQLDVQVANQVWVARTEQVRLEMGQTESLIKDAETGQRGFLYMGDIKYLADYQGAIGQVQPHIDRLTQLTTDDPQERAQVAQLRDLAQAKLSELAQTISLYQSGHPEQAKALVKSDQGFILMNNIRTLVGEMGQEQASHEATRSLAYQKSIKITNVCVYAASVIAVLGLILLCYSILRQIELRERHARRMEEREEWFRVTLTSLGDAVMATDAEGMVTFLNPIAEELMGLGIESVKGRPIGEVFRIFNETTHEPVENPIKKVLETGRIVGLANHTVLQKTDGAMIPIEDSAAPIRGSHDKIVGVVLVFRDATSERRTQELLRKSEKLAAAARLAASVAHEINNPLEAIGNLVYILAGTADLPSSAYENLALVGQELERLSHITRQTLGFYRESKEPDQVEISTLIDSVLKIFSNRFKTKNITIERDYHECPPVRGLAGELKQVVANLVTNAADAVPHGGSINIQVVCVERAVGKVVQLSIEDSGPGISPSIRDRIFEPFFTTKKDVGTGLGLWITKEIIDRHNGEIEVHSGGENNSTGTTFIISLPLSAEGQTSVE